MNWRVRWLINRSINFMRPQPRLRALTVGEILVSGAASDLVQAFNNLYYTSGVAGLLKWRGIPLQKNPCDLWMLIELMQLVRPSVIVETGTAYGGSALFFSDIMRLLELPCTIITVDPNPRWSFDPEARGIKSLIGYSTAPAIVANVTAIVNATARGSQGAVMVVLDSDHSEDNVTHELCVYSPFVTVGSYLIVEDTNVNGHPSSPDHGPGPFEAVEKFLARNQHFAIDPNCQKYLLTFNPNGWLRRVS